MSIFNPCLESLFWRLKQREPKASVSYPKSAKFKAVWGHSSTTRNVFIVCFPTENTNHFKCVAFLQFLCKVIFFWLALILVLPCTRISHKDRKYRFICQVSEWKISKKKVQEHVNYNMDVTQKKGNTKSVTLIVRWRKYFRYNSPVDIIWVPCLLYWKLWFKMELDFLFFFTLTKQ